MELKITNIGGQFQFWHMDCNEGSHEAPMYSPRYLDDGVKQFKCVRCGKKGRVTMPVITTGIGTLEEID